MRAPRVALIDPSLFTFAYDCALASGLTSAGAQVTLLGRRPRAGESLPFPAEPFFQRICERFRALVPVPALRGFRAIEHAWDVRRLSAALRDEDIAHFQWSLVPWLEHRLVADLSRRMPTVLTVHDSVPFHGAGGHHLQRMGLTRLLAAFTHLIVHTAEACGRLTSAGLDPSRISLIPHGVLTTPASGPAAKVEHTTILLFGTIKPYKGLDVLVEALGRISPEVRRRVRLRVVGTPMMPLDAIRRRAQVLGVAERIDWELRFVDTTEIGDMLFAADIVVFPYRQCDASGVLMCCLPHGRAVVASDLGVFRELLRDGVHGRLVGPEDPAALAAVLSELIEDQAARERYGARARDLAASLPTWEEIGRRTVALYATLLGPGSRAARMG